MMAGIFAFILTSAFVPEIAGAATTPRWAIAAVMLALIGPLRGNRFTAAHLFGVLFLAWAALSLAWTPNRYDGLDALIKLIVVAQAFWLGSKLESLRGVAIGLGLGIWLSSAVVIAEYRGVNLVAHATEHAGLFINSNSLGDAAGLALVAAVAYRVWWVIPGILPAFIMARCRGSFVAVAAAALIEIWKQSKLLAILAVLGGSMLVPNLWQAPSVVERLTMWSDMLPQINLLGHGIGSFYTLSPYYLSGMDTFQYRPEHLHNDWLEYGFELGAFGLAVIICIGFTLARYESAAIGIVIVFAVEACFGFGSHMPVPAVMAGIAAGYASRHGADLRDVIAAWRVASRKRFSGIQSRKRGAGVSHGSRTIPA